MRNNILILILIIFLIGITIAIYKWQFTNDNSIKDLQKQNEILQNKIDSLITNIEEYDKKYLDLSFERDRLDSLINVSEKNLSRLKATADSSYQELTDVRKKYLESQKKIEEFEYKKKEGKDLIKSLIYKL